MRKIDTAERRRRLAIRSHVAAAARAATINEVAADLVGIHATDPASVYLGTLARLDRFERDDMAAALYDERSVLKVLGMRRTMFVMPRDLAAVVQSAVTDSLAVTERKRLVQMLADAQVDKDVEAWISHVEKQTVDALDELGEATASQLTKRVPGLRVQISFGEGKKWAGKVGVSTRMLFLLATEGRIIRGRPRGSWLSSMYAWAPMEGWLGRKLDRPPVDDARAELVRRYLRSYGPATLRDIRWWTGWTVAATRKALAANEVAEVKLESGTGHVLAEDLESTPDPEPSIALLPALDTTTMGWVERGWYLGEHGPRLFDRNGNAGPQVWVDGRVVGGWAQRPTGEVVWRLFDDVGRERQHEIDMEAARIQRWLGESRIIPRFRTPTEVELAA